jgi:hypothetical protein
MNVKTIVLISALFFTGCSATRLTYQPQEHSDVSKSIKILKDSLSYQPPNHAVKSVEVRPDFFKIVGSNHRINNIHFDSIGNIDFHEKNEWKIVTIRGKRRRILYRLYVKDRTIAQNFINAVYTLQNHHKDLVAILRGPANPSSDVNNITKEIVVLPEKKSKETPIPLRKEDIERIESMRELDLISEKEYQKMSPSKILLNSSEEMEKLEAMKTLGLISEAEYKDKVDLLKK